MIYHNDLQRNEYTRRFSATAIIYHYRIYTIFWFDRSRTQISLFPFGRLSLFKLLFVDYTQVIGEWLFPWCISVGDLSVKLSQ